MLLSHVLLRLRAQQYLCRTVKLRAIDIVPRARGSHITHTHTLTTHTCGILNPVRATFHHVSPGAIARMCAPPSPSPNAPPPAAQPPSEPTPDIMLHEPMPSSATSRADGEAHEESPELPTSAPLLGAPRRTAAECAAADHDAADRDAAGCDASERRRHRQHYCASR